MTQFACLRTFNFKLITFLSLKNLSNKVGRENYFAFQIVRFPFTVGGILMLEHACYYIVRKPISSLRRYIIEKAISIYFCIELPIGYLFVEVDNYFYFHSAFLHKPIVNKTAIL